MSRADIDEMLKHQCEGCGGSGVRAPATPSCAIDHLTGWILVERCDVCEKFG